MRVVSLALCLLTAVALAAHAVVGPFSSVTFAWDRAPSHDSNIVFRLKYGPATNDQPFFLDAGTNTITTVTNPTSGYLYFTVVAVASGGLESEPSNLVIVTNPPASPLQLRLVTNTFPTVRLEGMMNGGIEWRTLALITNDAALLKGAVASMLIRASTNLPPVP